MAEQGGWPVSKGVHYQIEKSLATSISLHGRPLDDQESYTLVLSDYLCDGNGGCSFLKDYPCKDLGVYYRDALIAEVQWLAAQDLPVQSALQGRVMLKEVDVNE